MEGRTHGQAAQAMTADVASSGNRGPRVYPWAVSLHRGSTPEFPAVGAGVVVSPRHVLTCQHVVDRPKSVPGGAREARHSEAGTGWWVVCHQVLPFASVLAVEQVDLPEIEGCDVALLVLADDVPPQVKPAPVAWLEPPDLPGNLWWAYGHKHGDRVGGPARGQIGAHLGYGQVRLDLDGNADEKVDEGFSGGGVWSAEAAAVVALVTEYSENGGGRAVTLHVVREFLPQTVFSGGAPPSTPLRELSESSRSPAAKQLLARAVAPARGQMFGAVPQRPLIWVERPELIDQIESTFKSEPCPAVVCLSGPGGAGKTHLAAEYARRLSGAGYAVLWLPAETRDGLRDSLGSLARELNVAGETEDSVKAMRKSLAFLEVTDQQFLMVLDNAVDLDAVEPYLPRQGQVRVLITTRDGGSNFTDLGGIVPIPGLSTEQAIKLLTTTDRMAPGAAAELAQAVDGLPLALALFTQLRAPVVNDPDDPGETDASRSFVDAVTRILRQAIEAVARDHPDAPAVLQVLAVLSADGTSEQLLDHILGQPQSGALEAIHAAGLLTKDASGRLTLHRLTATQVRALHSDTLSGWVATTATRLETLVKDRTGTPTRNALDPEIINHARALVDLGWRMLLPESDLAVVVALANHATNMLDRSGDVNALLTLASTTADLASQRLGSEHPDTLTSRSNLAAGYRAVGRNAEAITLDEETLALLERVLGPEHPHTLTSRNNLAAGYQSVGRNAEANTLKMGTYVAKLRRRS